MQLRTPILRAHSRDNFSCLINESPRTSSELTRPKRIPVSTATQRKTPMRLFPLSSLPCSVESTLPLVPDTDRTSKPEKVSQKRFRLLLDANIERSMSPEMTKRSDSKIVSTQRNSDVNTPASTIQEKQLYRKQKSLFRIGSLDLKEKISIDHFLFPFNSARSSSAIKSADRFDLNLYEAGSDPNSKQTGASNLNSIANNTVISPGQTSGSQSGFFKTSIPTTNKLKTQIQKLDELKQIGPFKVNKNENSGFNSAREFGDGKDNPRYEIARLRNMFKAKKSVITSNKQRLANQEIFSKEILLRKLEIEETVEKNRDKIMVCALTESKEYGNLKYCFVSRETQKCRSPKTARAVREDVEFKITLHEIKSKLHLDNSYKFIHLLDGLPVFAFYQVPISERVVVISQNSRLGDASKVANHELVRKFINFREKRNESIGEVINGFNAQERKNECKREVLNIVDNTHQLNSEQLGKLVSLSNKAPTSDFCRAIHGAFVNSKVGSTLLEGEKSGTYIDKSFLNQVHSKKNSYLEILATQKPQFMRKPSLEIQIDEREVEKYIKSSRPLQENKKIAIYKNIIKEYDRKLGVLIRRHEEEDYEESMEEKNEGEDEEAEKRAKALKIDENLDVLLRKYTQPSDKNTNLEETKLDATHFKLITSSGSMSKTPQKKEADLLNLSVKRAFDQQDQTNNTQLSRTSIKGGEIQVAKRFIEENRKALDTKKTCIRKLNQVNKELLLKNIPKIIKERKVSRKELHSIYVVYKALCEVTSQRYKEYDINDGIDFETFRKGIYNMAMQSEELAARLFYAIDTNFSGFLDWEEFLEVMVTFRAKTLQDKIDLFIKIADEDSNGNLSENEIFTLSKICLGKFIKDDSDGFLDDLCHYFTKLIFTSLGYDISQEIPLEAIKEAIVSGNPESDLLAMFCGADL